MNTAVSPRLVFFAISLLSALGLVAWRTMPRQEDPTLPARYGSIVVAYPGASPDLVERLVVRPVELELAEVSDIKFVIAMARTGAAVFVVQLSDHVSSEDDVDNVWKDVRDALASAQMRFPDGASAPALDSRTIDIESVVISITGSDDIRVLSDAARRLEQRLLDSPLVKGVTTTGDRGEEVTIVLDEAAGRAAGVDALRLATILADRNDSRAAGTLNLGDRVGALQPRSEFLSVEEIAATPIAFPNGGAIPLRQIASVEHGATHHVPEAFRLNGAAGIALGVIPRDGINLVEFGERVSEIRNSMATELAPLEIGFVTFQPRSVTRQLDDLSNALGLSILTVALVLMAFMGVRLGAVVAAVVPVVVLSALALYAAAGGILHQISIAAFVIALGMLVDNAIVVAEKIQASLDEGKTSADAARDAVHELAKPLASATGTTLAAFLPMLLAEGPSADFTRAIPVIVMLTLVLSFFAAMTVTPMLAAALLRPSTKRSGPPLPQRVERLVHRSLMRPGLVLLSSALLTAGTLAAAPLIEQQFFPGADRNQVVVDVELPEGTPIETTNAIAARLEAQLQSLPAVDSVASFVGRGAPHFYYNISPRPQSPQLAQILVTTRTTADAVQTREDIRRWALAHVPEATVIPKLLQQGPTIAAPIEYRVYADTAEDLFALTREVMLAVRSVPGTRDVRTSIGVGVPTLHYRFDDLRVATHGLSRTMISAALTAGSRGILATQLRTGDVPIPVVVRAGRGADPSPDELLAQTLLTPDGRRVPLRDVLHSDTTWRSSYHQRRNRRRTATVLADLDPDVAFSTVMLRLRPFIERIRVPANAALELGGDSEGSEEANVALSLTVPLGLLALVVILLAEFNSFRRVGIVLSSVPLAAVGVIPGLLIGGQAFGFMTILGLIALAGIVVNNAIVLLDVADTSLTRGATPTQAMRCAVLERVRPIFLTTATTVGGLLPLAVSESTLWPPMAWPMISGLLASAGLTLFVVPALYVVVVRAPKPVTV
jgi:multidrug efflux pump subunit AcrB